MKPALWGAVPALPLLWTVAILLGVWLMLATAACHGWSARKVLVGTLGLALLFLAGAKVLYVLENPGRMLTSSWWHLFSHGFRFPGGLILCATAGPLLLSQLRLPVLSFLDVCMPAVAVAIPVARIGCLLNGCCFGATTSVPWSLSYPNGSRAFLSQRISGLLPEEAYRSLPVHPLPLYFVVAAVMILVMIAAWERRKAYEGEVALLFVTLWGISKALIEPFRGWNPIDAPTVGGFVGLVVAVLGGGFLAMIRLRRGKAKVVAPAMSPSEPGTRTVRH